MWLLSTKNVAGLNWDMFYAKNMHWILKTKKMKQIIYNFNIVKYWNGNILDIFVKLTLPIYFTFYVTTKNF